ncbi:heavy metal translocating P-type ATPase [Promicromonospora sukumoe]|uniref:Cation-transporting P-type ATPase B n=1 Tax=Promicromonospora sukumoe TaxID=88382 RepID=A0A7W3JDR3_9MICO|nr:heavy metal translocating P-type ATPase [Promicromonospora sukumoe]MBA8810963.1 Cu+-exporting ATPase [Promicromonospora sukumoe]
MPAAEALHPLGEVELAVSGMTCASCVARVERKLNRIDGVAATVNLPLESAHVVLSADVADQDLVGAVESAGYEARVTRRRAVRGPGGGDDAGADTGAGLPDAGSARPGAGSDVGDGEESPAPASGDGYRGADLLRRLRVSAVLTVPVLLLSMVPAWSFPGSGWVVAALALPVVVWGAWPFHAAAVRAARHGSSTMDTLVSIGVVAATLWSLWVLVAGSAPHTGHGTGPAVYFEVGAVVTTFLLAGRYAEHRSRRRAGDALRALLSLGAKDAERIALGPDGTPLRLPEGGWRTTPVPVAALQVGDVFAVRPGGTVATDGTVVEGASALDTSLVTGEPVPVDVIAGDDVVGGTVSTSGHLLVRATRVGEDTMLARIGRLVARAQTGKAPVALLADRISAVFVPVVLVLAVLTLAGWLALTGDVEAAFTAAVAVLIIACPCALGLATPTAILVGTGRGAQLGVLIRGPEILESTRRVDTVVLDKTGTVTEGRMRVVDVWSPDRSPALAGVGHSSTGHAGAGHDAGQDGVGHAAVGHTGQEPSAEADDANHLSNAPEVLRYAAAVEALSEHPIARAIAAAGRAGAEPETPLEVTGFVAHAGGGVEGLVRHAHAGLAPGGGLNTRRVLVGRPDWLAEQGVTVSAEVRSAVGQQEEDGATAVVVAWNGAAGGVIALRDPAKATSAEAVEELRELGLRPYLLTGDSAGAARVAARAVGIPEEDVVARVMPAGKAEVVARLQAEGRTVAMVGDGVNDAAALATADLGLAMGTGTDVAIEAGDITLVRGDLRAAASAVRLSRKTLRIIKQNLFWAFAYNVAAIPLAAAGLLSPMIAGGAMAASSVLVVANSLRLRRAA